MYVRAVPTLTQMITPLVLTYNEEPNIGATLTTLAWAPRVVVLDSGSTDKTEEIARSFRNVAWVARTFDNHGNQWQYGIRQTDIETEYVLALDADMRPSSDFVAEVEEFANRGNFAGACVPFEYRVLGRRLRGSIYPPQVRIFRRHGVRVTQPGHSQVFEVSGPVYRFRSAVIHEDFKPFDRWLINQTRYAALEAERIRAARTWKLKDSLRRLGISPLLWGIFAYARAGGPLNSPAARAYGYERLIFEAMLARTLAAGSGREANFQ